MKNYKKDYFQSKIWTNLSDDPGFSVFRILDGTKVISPNTDDLNENYLFRVQNLIRIDDNYWWRDDAQNSQYIYETYGIMTEVLRQSMSKDHGDNFMDLLKDDK